MSLTLTELKQRIAERVDEISILELLEINSFDLVERFGDRIEDKFDSLITEFEEDNID